MEREEINALKTAYRELFEEGNPLQEVAQSISESTSSEKVKQLCEFIKTSKRGIPFRRTKTNEDKK
jgi:UDP-N-acetylglucosamine acyltransferase